MNNNNKLKNLIQTKFGIKHHSQKNKKNKQIFEDHVRDFTKMNMDSIQNFYISSDKNDNNKEKNKNKTDDKEKNKDIHYYGDDLDNTKLNPTYMKNKIIHVCVYHMITEYIKPFVMFLLYKEEDGDILHLPVVNTFNIEDVVNKFNHIFKDLNVDIKYKGYIENDNDVYLILEKKNNKKNKTDKEQIIIDKNEYNSKWWWALSSEIVNYKKVLNFDIDYEVTRFFLNNIKLLFIHDKKGQPYECPIVGYYRSYYKNSVAAAVLGVQREFTSAAIFGPYYYFEQEMREDVDEKDGLARFALFIGKIKVSSGSGGDWIDENYDSILSSGNTKNSVLAVKTHEQQVPLSYEAIIL